MSSYLLILHDAKESSPEGRHLLMEQLALSLNMPMPKVAALFDALPAILCYGLTNENAERFGQVLDNLGAVVEVMAAPDGMASADSHGGGVLSAGDSLSIANCAATVSAPSGAQIRSDPNGAWSAAAEDGLSQLSLESSTSATVKRSGSLELLFDVQEETPRPTLLSERRYGADQPPMRSNAPVVESDDEDDERLDLREIEDSTEHETAKIYQPPTKEPAAPSESMSADSDAGSLSQPPSPAVIAESYLHRAFAPVATVSQSDSAAEEFRANGQTVCASSVESPQPEHAHALPRHGGMSGWKLGIAFSSVMILAAGIPLVLSSREQTTSISIDVARLLAEQSQILGQKQGDAPPPEPLQEWSGELREGAQSMIVQLFRSSDGFQTGRIETMLPEPPPISLQDLAAGKVPPVWLRRAEGFVKRESRMNVAPGDADRSASTAIGDDHAAQTSAVGMAAIGENGDQLRGVLKAYVGDVKGNDRIVLRVTVSVDSPAAPDGSQIAQLDIRTADLPPDTPAPVIRRSPSKRGYDVHLRGQVVIHRKGEPGRHS